MTDYEKAALEATIQNDYQHEDYDDMPGTHVWAWSVHENMDGVPVASRGGVIASCVKKGWLEVFQDGVNRDDDTIAITAKGLDVALEAGIRSRYDCP
jgi:hypothetical protein